MVEDEMIAPMSQGFEGKKLRLFDDVLKM